MNDKPTILLVDDTESARYTVAHFLRHAGYEVVEAAAGEECLKLMAEREPDLVLLDVKLPDISGIEVCRRLKSQPRTANVPVIQVSAFFTGTDHRIAGLESGADVYLTTPFEPKELLAQINALLRLRQAEAALGATEQLNRRISEVAPCMLYIYDLIEERTVWGNQQMVSILGYESEQLVKMGSRVRELLMHPDDWLNYQEHRKHLFSMADGEIAEFEYRMLHVNGSWVWVSSRDMVFQRAKNGSVVQVIGAALDISEHKRQELLLQESEQRLRSVLENSLDAAYRRDLRTDTYDYLSPVIEQVMGIAPEVMRRLSAEEVLARVHPDDRERACRAIEEGLRSLSGRLEYRFKMDNGQYRWLADFFTVQTDANGTPIFRGGIVRDISQRKQADELLRESEQRFRCLYNANVVGLVLAEISGRIHEANDEFLRTVGYTREDLKAGRLNWKSLTPPEHLGKDLEAGQKLLEAGRHDPFEKDCIHQDGTRVPVLIGAAYLGGDPIMTFSTVVDLTNQKRATQALAEARNAAELERQRLAAVLEALPAGVGIAGLDGRISHFNAALLRIWGQPAMPRTIEEYQHWRGYWNDSGKSISAEEWAMARALRTGEVVPGDIVDIEKFDGTGRATIINAAAPIRDAQGRIVGGVVTEVDITAQKKAEQALRESEQRLRLAQAAVRFGVFDRDLLTGETRWDERIRQLWGVGQEVPVSYETFVSGIHPDDRRLVEEAVRDAEHIPSEHGLTVLYRVINRVDGRTRWISESSKTIFEKGRPVRIVGAVQDVTEQQEFQAELERLVGDRTARLQELVAELEHFSYTITHDMRAPLRAMRGFAEVLNEMGSESLDPDMKVFVQRIVTSAERMDLLITDALNYSKAVRQELPVGPVDLHHLLQGMLDTYPEFQADRAHIRLEPPLPRVIANEAGLTQCFSNLLGNAVKFVEPGKKPQVRIHAEFVPAPDAPQDRGLPNPQQDANSGDARSPSEWVRIWVEDQGIGISERMMPRIFHMFSRASKQYEGTGIGLALVRKVIHRIGGRVGVESGLGKGSRFWIELPAADSASNQGTE